MTQSESFTDTNGALQILRFWKIPNSVCCWIQDDGADIAAYKAALWQFLSVGWKTGER